MKVVRANSDEIITTKKPIVEIKQGDSIKVENQEFIVKDAKKEEKTIFIETEKCIETEEIENLMNELLPKVKEDERNITFEITLTKRQKEIFDKKGGISWLKKMITGNKRKK